MESSSRFIPCVAARLDDREHPRATIRAVPTKRVESIGFVSRAARDVLDAAGVHAGAEQLGAHRRAQIDVTFVAPIRRKHVCGL
jgi:hypothetical protein